jgi:hypothetical protein
MSRKRRADLHTSGVAPNLRDKEGRDHDARCARHIADIRHDDPKYDIDTTLRETRLKFRIEHGEPLSVWSSCKIVVR